MAAIRITPPDNQSVSLQSPYISDIVMYNLTVSEYIIGIWLSCNITIYDFVSVYFYSGDDIVASYPNMSKGDFIQNLVSPEIGEPVTGTGRDATDGQLVESNYKEFTGKFNSWINPNTSFYAQVILNEGFSGREIVMPLSDIRMAKTPVFISAVNSGVYKSGVFTVSDFEAESFTYYEYSGNKYSLAVVSQNQEYGLLSSAAGSPPPSFTVISDREDVYDFTQKQRNSFTFSISLPGITVNTTSEGLMMYMFDNETGDKVWMYDITEAECVMDKLFDSTVLSTTGQVTDTYSLSTPFLFSQSSLTITNTVIISPFLTGTVSASYNGIGTFDVTVTYDALQFPVDTSLTFEISNGCVLTFNDLSFGTV